MFLRANTVIIILNPFDQAFRKIVVTPLIKAS